MVLLDCHVQKDERFQSTFVFLAYLNDQASGDCSRLHSWCHVMAELTGAVSLLLRPAVAFNRREGVSCGVSWDLMTWILRERGDSGKTPVLDTPILKNSVTFDVTDGWFCCLFCKKFHILDVNDKCKSFSGNWKFGSKSNLQRSCHCHESTVFSSVCLCTLWVGEMFG